MLLTHPVSRNVLTVLPRQRPVCYSFACVDRQVFCAGGQCVCCPLPQRPCCCPIPCQESLATAKTIRGTVVCSTQHWFASLQCSASLHTFFSLCVCRCYYVCVSVLLCVCVCACLFYYQQGSSYYVSVGVIMCVCLSYCVCVCVCACLFYYQQGSSYWFHQDLAFLPS